MKITNEQIQKILARQPNRAGKHVALVVLANCNDCPYFDNEYYGYEQTCTILDRAIGDYNNPIPADCPVVIKRPS